MEVEFGWHEGVAVSVVVPVDVAAAGAGGAVVVVADGDDGRWAGSWKGGVIVCPGANSGRIFDLVLGRTAEHVVLVHTYEYQSFSHAGHS